MEPFSSPAVSIDGEVIKRLREEGRLTQLYVAKVVGVTTDTVSRWENNRYPTIRRDNALKLAEALEVDLARILKQDECADEVAATGSGTLKRGFGYRYLLPAVGLVLIACLWWVKREAGAPQPIPLKAHRHVPKFAAPGTRIPVRLELESPQSLKGLIVREVFPEGWMVVESDPPPASLDNLQGTVRWMLRNPEQSKRIVYMLKVPENAREGAQVELQGEMVANPDGQRFAAQVTSTGPLTIAPLHWADMNGNSKIDDLEILDVSDIVDASQRIHFDWELLEKLWDAGAYTFDPTIHQFMPQKAAEAAAASP